jgi:hypothetical protein
MLMYHAALQRADAYMCGLVGLQLCTLYVSLDVLAQNWLQVPEDTPETLWELLREVPSARVKPAVYINDGAPDWWCAMLLSQYVAVLFDF